MATIEGAKFIQKMLGKIGTAAFLTKRKIRSFNEGSENSGWDKEWGCYKAIWPSVKNKQRYSSKISHGWTLQEFREECWDRPRQKHNMNSPSVTRGQKVCSMEESGIK